MSGVDFPDDARALAVTDWDHDGDLDVWISNRTAPRLRLMRNDTQTKHHFLVIRLQGDGSKTNKDAIGARVEVVIRNSERDLRPVIKTLHAGEGFLAQSSKWLHFGLGDSTDIEKILVKWPGGELEEFSGFNPDRRYKLTQGSGEAVELGVPQRKSNLSPSPQDPLPISDEARVPLIAHLRLPLLRYSDFMGRDSTLPIGSGKSVLINMWASWCQPCVAELKAITEREKDLRDANIEVVALSVDGLGDDPGDPKDAYATISKLHFPFAAGRANFKLVQLLQLIQDSSLSVSRPLPLPASFLVDPQGRVTVIYKGPVSVDALLEDSRHAAGSRMERFERAAQLPGSVSHASPAVRSLVATEAQAQFYWAMNLDALGHRDLAMDVYNDLFSMGVVSATVHNNAAIVLHQNGQSEKAIEHLNLAIKIKPDYFNAWHNRGNVYLAQGNLSQALSDYNKVIEIRPALAEAHHNRGYIYRQYGRFKLAVENYSKAIELNPWDSQAYVNRGEALQQLKDYQGTVNDCTLAIKLNPNSAVAYNRRGVALEKLAQYARAREDYLKAMELNPNLIDAGNNLAWLCATCPDADHRNGTEAVQIARLVCEKSNWQSFNSLDSLAAAYAETGEFDEAVKRQTQAIELAPELVRDDLRGRLELYKSRRPYREVAE